MNQKNLQGKSPSNISKIFEPLFQEVMADIKTDELLEELAQEDTKVSKTKQKRK